jgi:hypothetical protein
MNPKPSVLSDPKTALQIEEEKTAAYRKGGNRGRKIQREKR